MGGGDINMKLIIQDTQEISVDLENPVIIIKDENNPSRQYLVKPIGGFIKFVANYDKSVFEIEAKTSSEIIQIKEKNR